MIKYPRTQHIEGSKLQPGDEDLSQVKLSSLRGATLVIEEKLDGANAALSFVEGELRLQSRGHYLTGGAREKHFAMFKTWAASQQATLRAALGDRYVVFGEWLYAKHTIFYDALPHYFMEFDVWDTESSTFLDTPRRHALLAGLPIEHVPLLHTGSVDSIAQLRAMIATSRYKTERWRDRLSDHVRQQTDPSDLAEGLYIKREKDGVVAGRYKLIRRSFLQSVHDSGSHWLSRPIFENRLAEGVDIFAK